jgi:hypothetical protein
MQANQKLEAEAGALRVLLQQSWLMPSTQSQDARRGACQSTKTCASRIALSLQVTDAGKEVAERITGYQEQLKLNTRLIELLRDHSNLAGRAESGVGEVSTMRWMSFAFQRCSNCRRGHAGYAFLLRAQGTVAAFNVHKYADLLSMATKLPAHR